MRHYTRNFYAWLAAGVVIPMVLTGIPSSTPWQFTALGSLVILLLCWALAAWTWHTARRAR